MNKEELKGKQWLLDEYNEMVNSPKTEHPLIDVGYETALKDFKELIDQLDEPEKPVIPQFVAEWIESNRDTVSLVEAAELMSYRANDKDLKVFDWATSNPDLFARAWLDGYTVEEKKYRVKLGSVYLGSQFSGNNIVFTKEEAFIFNYDFLAKNAAELVGGTIEEVQS